MRDWARLSFLAVAFLWGTSFAFQKVLLNVIDPFTFIFWNFVIAWLVLLCIALFTKVHLFYRVREGLFLGLLLAALELFQVVGLHASTAADTVFISNLGMLLIPYAGWIIFRHKVAPNNIIALVLAIIGMYFLVGGIGGFSFGQAMLLVSAIAMSLYFLYSQRFESERGSCVLALLVQQFFMTALIAGLATLMAGEMFSVPAHALNAFMLQTMLFTVLPFVLIQWASRWSDEMIAALYDGVVEPLVGGIVAWVFFAEPATALNIIGGLLMVVAFTYAGLSSNKHFLRKSKRIVDALVH